MAFRGRGRGRERGAAFDTRLARHEPYILFPENVPLPDLANSEAFTNEERVLVSGKIKLEYFWKASCYHLEEGFLKSKSQDSDKPKRRAQVKRGALSSYLKLTSSNFPAELIHRSKLLEPEHNKLRWDQGSDERTLESFEKLEDRSKGHNEKDAPERKGESDDEGVAKGEAEEESSDDDYNQNIDFDDDEDDLNMEEEADEDFYE
ncbi:DNA-directed RNA polymerase III subunit Rpc31 protein [Dioscorea alata]|uniref:DNA-directed RNA polymerase III subunit Rpc31 protein n=1 Tax=Dioscorea alata TaxID=55571 RepID=A0ACB7WQJ4_DIOAL|nr:DNA-directed RNA polymerase III subunit Rpc31 protein [Dioscorea alata]